MFNAPPQGQALAAPHRYLVEIKNVSVFTRDRILRGACQVMVRPAEMTGDEMAAPDGVADAMAEATGLPAENSDVDDAEMTGEMLAASFVLEPPSPPNKRPRKGGHRQNYDVRTAFSG